MSGLGSQATARQGNALGILGVGSGVLASLGAVGFSPEVITQFTAVAGIGALAGTIIGRRVTATELPQTVALLHSIVGLSAVLTSIGSVLQDPAHLSTLHSVTAYLGVVIGDFFFFVSSNITHQPRLLGGITFTGSIVAFLKLAGRLSSKPLNLPGKHLVNTTLLGANAATMAGFLSMAPSTPLVAASFLGVSTILSFLKGYTTTAAIGGADMRMGTSSNHRQSELTTILAVVITVLNAYSLVLFLV